MMHLFADAAKITFLSYQLEVCSSETKIIVEILTVLGYFDLERAEIGEIVA